MLTVTVRDIVASANVIQELVNTARGRKFSPRIGRYLGVHVFDAVAKVHRDFYKARDGIITSYEYKNADGVPEVPKEKMPDFTAAIEVIMDEKRDLPNLYKIKDEELASADLTPAEWRTLGWLLSDIENV